MGRTKPQYQKPGMVYAIQEDEIGLKLKKARTGKEGYTLLQPGIYLNLNFGLSKTLIALIPTAFLDYGTSLQSTTIDKIEIKGKANITYKINEPIRFMQNIPENQRPLKFPVDYKDPSPVDYENKIISEVVKSKTNQIVIAYKINEVNEKRAEIEEKTRKAVEEPLKKYGLTIGDFNLDKFELPEFYTFAREKEIELEFEKGYETKEVEFNNEIARKKLEARIKALTQLRGLELECFRQQKETKVQCLGEYGKMSAEVQRKLIDNYLISKEKDSEIISKIIKEIGSAMGTNNPREVLYAFFMAKSDSEEAKKLDIDFKIAEKLQKEIEKENERALLELENMNKRLKGQGQGLEKALEESTIIQDVGEAAKKVGINPDRYFEITRGNIPRLDVNLASRKSGQLKKLDKEAYPNDSSTS